MTTADHSKVLVQIKHKKGKFVKWKKNNTPRKRAFGESTKKCVRCGRTGGHISKYLIHLCRQCFRESATKLGFKKYS
ncbi:30S ribosomal protein S14 [Candidatus Woesearchaeota archaeon]|nr:30S ribosomal protein S14 [Candidatus Woesearchaeota archaeon]